MEVTSKVYRKRLAESVTGGALEAADSKAAFLQNLCEELNFDTEKAIEIHEGIHEQKKIYLNRNQLHQHHESSDYYSDNTVYNHIHRISYLVKDLQENCLWFICSY